MEWFSFLLDQGHSGVMQQQCITYRCIYVLASFNFNDRPLSQIIFADVGCVNATIGYLEC